MVSPSSSYSINSSSSVTCTGVMKSVTLSSAPSFYSSVYSYSNANHACYWSSYNGGSDVNLTKFTFSFSTPSNCGYSGNTLMTLFTSSFNPATVYSISTSGTFRA